MDDWIHKYPQVQALLQRQADTLDYAQGDEAVYGSDAAWPAEIVALPGTITWQEQVEMVRRIADTIRQDEQEGIWGPCGHPLDASPDGACRWCGAVPHGGTDF